MQIGYTRWVLRDLSDRWRIASSLVREAVVIVLASLTLLMPAAWNGLPFPNSDTLSYLRVGEAAVGSFLDVVSDRSQDDARGADDLGSTSPIDDSQVASPVEEDPIRMGTTYLGARSVYYGVPAYLLVALGGFWAVAFAQAVLASMTLRMVLPGGSPLATLAFATGLTLATPLGFLVSNIMPDLFIGLGALAVAALCGWYDRLGAGRIVFLGAILFCAVTFHSTHGPILAAALLAGAAVGAHLGCRLMRPRYGLVLLLLFAGLAALVGAKQAAKQALGEPLRDPPFLMARVVADGPGRTFLEQECATRELALCGFRDRPLVSSAVILWSSDLDAGVFWPSDYETRIRLIEEQAEVVWGAIRTDPLGVFAASAANVLSLGQRAGVAAELDWNMPEEIWRDFDHYAPGASEGYASSSAYRNTLPFGIIDKWFLAVGAISFAGALFLLARSGSASILSTGQSAIPVNWVVMGTVILAAAAANILLCGVASGPEPRYGARVLWLWPVAFVVLWHGARCRYNALATAQSDDVDPASLRSGGSRVQDLPVPRHDKELPRCR